MAETNRAALLAPFHPDSYDYNPKGLVYIKGTVLEQRLDHATGGRWSIIECQLRDRESHSFDRNGKRAVCDVVCELVLELPGLGRRPGHGQMTYWAKADYDDACKGATTAALRSAANRFGVGREIWSELVGEHWRHWLSLVTTHEQTQYAQSVLMATFRWLDSNNSSRDHKDAWNACADDVQAALDQAIERVAGGPRQRELRDTDEPAAVHEDHETREAEADRSDQATMRRLSAMATRIMECQDAKAATRLGKEFAKEFGEAVEDGRIRRGGECERNLDGRMELARAHVKRLHGGTAEATAATAEDIAKGLIEEYRRASTPDELAAAELAHDAVRGQLGEWADEVEDELAKASEMLANAPVAAGAGR